jgi:hypothetical protein
VGGAVDIVGAAGRGTTVRFSVPCVEPPSSRPYLARAMFWAVFVTVALVMVSRDTAIRPLWLTLLLIAGIAVARYTVAAVARIRAGRTA